jgi:hypothetical protein
MRYGHGWPRRLDLLRVEEFQDREYSIHRVASRVPRRPERHKGCSVRTSLDGEGGGGIVDLAITSRATTTRKTLRPSGGASSGVPSSLTGACCTVARTLPLPYLTINSVIIAPLRRTLGPLTMPGPIITCLPMLPFLYCPRGITRRSAVSVHLVQVWSLGIL